MSTLKVNAIRGTGASSDAISVNSTDGTCTAKITNNLSNRRININGDMRIAQRGTSSTNDGYHTVDRYGFSYGGENEAPTQAQHVLTSSDTGPWEKGFRHSFHITNGNQTGGAGVNDYSFIYTTVEAQDMANCGWDYTNSNSYITLSYWIKSSVAQTFYGHVYSNDGTAQSYSLTTGALSANTWTKVTQKIPGRTGLQFNNDNGYGLIFNLIAPFVGTSRTSSGHSINTWMTYDDSDRFPDETSTWWTTNDATIEVTGVQLEVGDVATEYEHKLIGDEIMRCYRYFYMHASGTNVNQFDENKSVGTAVHYTNTSWFGPIFFPTQMRTHPSLYKSLGTDRLLMYNSDGSQGFNDVALQMNGQNCYMINYYDSLDSDEQAGWVQLNNNDAYLGFNAELG